MTTWSTGGVPAADLTIKQQLLGQKIAADDDGTWIQLVDTGMGSLGSGPVRILTPRLISAQVTHRKKKGLCFFIRKNLNLISPMVPSKKFFSIPNPTSATDGALLPVKDFLFIQTPPPL